MAKASNLYICDDLDFCTQLECDLYRSLAVVGHKVNFVDKGHCLQQLLEYVRFEL